MAPIVSIEDVGKRYRIGGLHPGYQTLREIVGGVLLAPFRKREPISDVTTIWALKGINLEVQPGELVGLIGHNGAGKSTLLKILSRITRPTTGRVRICGRVGSLLEVGTGFHPDLTGRENIFLSGAILGMRRDEVSRKFDEIVAFSELEKFIDTPVKWYSSGMYVRLGFSVAAHLEPEVLMMDEVLAVGDASFQQKCLDKMHAIRQEGRTIFFVSHSMPAVTRLCKRAILLNKGSIVVDGPAQPVVNQYLDSSWNVSAIRDWEDPASAPGNEVVRLRRVRVRTEDGETATAVDVRRPVGIEITYEVLSQGHALLPAIEVANEDGVHLFTSYDFEPEWRRRPRPVGKYTSTAWIPANLLAEGGIVASVSITSRWPRHVTHAHERNVVGFQAMEGQAGDPTRGEYRGPMPGVVRPKLKWTTCLGTANENDTGASVRTTIP